ncbi:MAG: hypothetical protein ACXVI3_04185 [Halobacteriota archaeon]
MSTVDKRRGSHVLSPEARTIAQPLAPSHEKGVQHLKGQKEGELIVKEVTQKVVDPVAISAVISMACQHFGQHCTHMCGHMWHACCHRFGMR